MSDRKRVFYVLSLSHSGSTIFSIELAKAFGGMAIGESHSVFAHSIDDTEGVGNICSCGKQLSECPFWGPFLDANAKDMANLSSETLYERMLDEPTPHGIDLLVDASKKEKFLTVLREVHEKGRADPFVILLIRDVRGWVFSDRAAWARKNPSHHFSLLYHLYAWTRGNDRFQRSLRESGLPYITVGYEEFCFDNERIFSRIEEASGWQRKDGEWAHHVAHSNRAKMHVGKIIYDSTWMKSWRMNALYSLIPWIAKKNATWVYGAVTLKRSKKNGIGAEN